LFFFTIHNTPLFLRETWPYGPPSADSLKVGLRNITPLHDEIAFQNPRIKAVCCSCKKEVDYSEVRVLKEIACRQQICRGRAQPLQRSSAIFGDRRRPTSLQGCLTYKILGENGHSRFAVPRGYTASKTGPANR
jgi:hypothetical protein